MSIISRMPTNLAKYSNPDGVVPDRATWTPWLRAWRMLIDAKHHGDIYEAFLGMEAPVFARAYYQVRSHPKAGSCSSTNRICSPY